jgi:hypothetical protein
MRTFRGSRRIGGGAAAVAVGLGLALAVPLTAAAETYYVASFSTGGIDGFVGPGVKSFIFDDGFPPSPLPQPRDLAMSPDGRTIYAVTGEALTPVDRDTRALGAPIPVGAGDGSRIAVTPDGRTALVTSPAGDKVTPVDTAAGTAGPPIPLTHPTDLAVTPDGKTAYVLTAGSTLTPIDLATATPKAPIALSHPGAAIAVTPDGALALVAESEGQQTPAPGPSAMQVIDLTAGTPEPPVPLAAAGVGALELTPDGKTAYVAITDTTKIPFDVATRTPAAAIGTARPEAGIDNSATDLAVSFDGQHLFGTIPCGSSCSGSVFSINFNQPFNPPPGGNEAGATTFGGFSPVTSPGARPAPSSIVLAPSPGVTLFDNGAQHNPHPQMDLVHTLVANPSNPGGSVAAFAWQFGDGSPDVTNTAGIADHTFPRYGTYKVTLTTTNQGGCADQVVYTGHSATCTGRTTATATRMVTVAPVPIPISAHTGPTGRVTTSGATLNGTIDTAGYDVTWHFEYGTTSRYGHYLPAQTIFGLSPVTVPVSRTLTTLRPKTLYHYRLVAESSAGTSTGGDATFTTRATGTLPLRSTTLPLSGTRSVAAVRCASLKPCRGRLTLTIRARDSRHRLITSTCGHATFNLKAEHSGRTRIPLSARCRSRLRHAPKGRLAAKLTSTTTTGQTDLAKTVRLTR